MPIIALIAGNLHPVGFIVSLVLVAFVLYMLCRRNPYTKKEKEKENGREKVMA